MQHNQTEELGSCSVGKLLFKLAVPAIAAQIINLLYNLVDRMYIGHIENVGKLALTGVGVCLPLIMLISAFAALVSMGAAPRASIFLGKGEKDNAEKTLGNSFSLLIILSLIITVIFSLFSKDLLLIFGASENTIEFAVSYMKIYSLGTIFVQLTLGLNAFISAQGFAKTSMMTVLIGAIFNIILDPIFIFGFNMGVSGAALATIISQSLSMIWILFFLTGKKTTLKLRKKNLRLSKDIILPSILLGLAPFIMQSTESLIAVCFNSSLLKYGGDVAVGAMTILTSVMQFSMLPLTGLTQGGQPIISYNYGAKNAERVKKAFKILLISCVVYSFVLWGLAMITPRSFVLIFNNDPELVEFTSHALRIYMAVSCVFGIQIACQQSFIALGNAKTSLFLALLRKILLLVPLIYIMPLFMTDKTTAVFMAEPVADILAVSTTAILFFIQFKKAMKEISEPLELKTKSNLS
ncbi:MATE family efflux transporter [Clostridium sp. D53t1_180928_C8]|uniref:MATE family efflux transporter n=1 Tax=Clostridium sp. D53t1_180928_C8 TaxID=2787101 RepID=UPI0018AC4015|nr:MATE family efflux transporter [Clostridium sp. D53t1_180928_C8]